MNNPLLKDLVLVGGGHSHIIFLRMWAMNPVKSVRLTLISDQVDTPYSGMLPGYIAGDYNFDEVHIDLVQLCEFVGARFINTSVRALDPDAHKLFLDEHPPVGYDCLSINIGSQPSLETVLGGNENGIPIKPVSNFLTRWEAFLENVRGKSKSTVVVGAGAAGVETALCIKKAHPELRISLVQRDKNILPQHSQKVRKLVEQALLKQEIRLLANNSVIRVSDHQVELSSGSIIDSDFTIFTTHASAASWVKSSNLQIDKNGFILVKSSLQSENYSNVFAAGDIASIKDLPRPKSGVFAVRQGKPLFNNIRNYLQGLPLDPFKPQKRFLSLLNIGDETILSRGRLAFAHPLLSRYKDHIDKKFMAKFQNLNPILMVEKVALIDADEDKNQLMRCQGCASKVGGTILHKALSRVSDTANGSNLQFDDAAIIEVPKGAQLLQTVDHLTAFVKDPYLFGRIAANHCLSDIYAMGGQPHSVLANVIVPFASETIMEDDIYHLLKGVLSSLKNNETKLLGGHTSEGDIMSLGLTVNGYLMEESPLTKLGAKPGDQLILSKPLGTGVLFAGAMRIKSKGRWINAALESMLRDNRQASICFRRHQANALTDITGFGLLGHLSEMFEESNLNFRLFRNRIPKFPGVEYLSQLGIKSSIYPQNCNYFSNLSIKNNSLIDDIFVDPQTSGGLLAAVPRENSEACLVDLRTNGYRNATIIGEVFEKSDGSMNVLQ